MVAVQRALRRQLAEVRAELKQKIIEAGGYDVVAEQIGCSREALYNLTGEQDHKRMSLEMAKAIQDLLGIRMERWAGEYRFKRRGRAA